MEGDLAHAAGHLSRAARGRSSACQRALPRRASGTERRPAFRDASSNPAGGGARDDVLFAAAVGGLVLTAASALAAAFGPGNTARVATFVSLIVVGVITAAVLLKRARMPRWRDVRHRPWLLAGAVVVSLVLVAIAVVAVTALTAESWQAQADGI